MGTRLGFREPKSGRIPIRLPHLLLIGIPRGRWLLAARRNRISKFVEGWRKEHPGEPFIPELSEASSYVPAELRSTSLREVRSWLAECESTKTALETEFPHLGRVHSPYSERQQDWEYNLCAVLIPYLRREISRRARTGTPPIKESTTSNDFVSPAQIEFRHSPDYRSVTHRGKQHSLTPRQAQMIQILHEAYQNWTPEVSIHAILEQLGTSASRWQDTFKGNPDAREALITKGKSKGTLRLNL
jgi:hypothetical protein